MLHGFAGRAARYRDRIEAVLERVLPPAGTHPARFHTALRYSVLGGGKRLRPLLVYASGEWLGLAPARLDAMAAAIELVHAYSLVHDDLPAMDDDNLRRGRATTHVAFGEAVALLVGDALQAHAYALLAGDASLDAPARIRAQLVRDLAQASGSVGMAGGQAMDIGVAAARPTAEEIEELYWRKTGCLLQAAVVMPARLDEGLAGSRIGMLDRYARSVGLAFQIADDILDVDSPTEVSGKPQGSDIRHGKVTLLARLGPAACRGRLEELRAEALAALGDRDEAADGLRTLCDWITRRDR